MASLFSYNNDGCHSYPHSACRGTEAESSQAACLRSPYYEVIEKGLEPKGSGSKLGALTPPAIVLPSELESLQRWDGWGHIRGKGSSLH